MNITEIILTIAIIILAVIMMAYYIKSKRGFIKLIFGVVTGIGGIAVLSLAVPQLITLNLFNLCVSGILGLPGVLLLLGLTIV